MRKSAILVTAFAATLCLTGTSSGHHPPKMERCANVELSGEIERIEWRLPHVELLIRTDDGMLRRLTWLAINQLALVDIRKDTLQVGDRVDVAAGIQLDDVEDRPMLLSYIHRDGDGWGWSQVPQGC